MVWYAPVVLDATESTTNTVSHSHVRCPTGAAALQAFVSLNRLFAVPLLIHVWSPMLMVEALPVVSMPSIQLSLWFEVQPFVAGLKEVHCPASHVDEMW